jgi:hypothetical protein
LSYPEEKRYRPVSESGGGYPLTLSAVVGALLSGIGGARVVTNEVERRFSKATQQELAKAMGEWIKTQRS